MKKILFLQIKSNEAGGVWFVNKTIGEELVSLGYDVRITSMRNEKTSEILKCDPKIKLCTLNEQDPWEIPHRRDVLNEFKKGKIFSTIRIFREYLKEQKKLNKDFQKLKEHIIEYDPDIIITTQYQLLNGIPEQYLSRTIHEHHISFDFLKDYRDNLNTLLKFKDKITFLWLTKASCEKAIEIGLTNSTYIYNPIRFISKEKANVVKNKKLVTIARIAEVKRIDLMIEIAEEIFKDSSLKDWTLEIYGFGPETEKIKSLIKNNQIKFMGSCERPQEALLTSSINLNTSLHEGFSLSILEACECGVPTVTFNFGESVYEEIEHNKNGIIINQDDKESYIKELKRLMKDEKRLKEMSQEASLFAKNFNSKNVVKEWEKLFDKINKNC